MKVWIVLAECYVKDGESFEEVVGVYATEELARQAITEGRASRHGANVADIEYTYDEWEVQRIEESV